MYRTIPVNLDLEAISYWLEFILRIYFKFFYKHNNQTYGAAMRAKCISCTSKFHSYKEIRLIKDNFKCYMDGGFLIWPAHFNFDNFIAPWCSGYHYCTTSFNKT